MSTGPSLPPLVISGSSSDDKAAEGKYARLRASCKKVGGEWLTEEGWRAKRLLKERRRRPRSCAPSRRALPPSTLTDKAGAAAAVRQAASTATPRRRRC